MKVIHSKTFNEVVDLKKNVTDVPDWFEGALLNYAENMLRYRDDKPAIVSSGKIIRFCRFIYY